VVDCVNEETTKDAKLYLFPNEHATRQEWMKMCGIQTTMPKTAWICQIHFDFEDVHSFRCRQLMADGGPCVCFHAATLQEGVIPKHFLPAEGQKHIDFLTARSKRIEKRDKKKIVKEILDKVTVSE
jgi:hypothetical protein